MASHIKPLKILQASAGSGKTFSLTVYYLSLLFTGLDKYKEILAITFTNKATAEMKQRILYVLKAFAQGSTTSDIESYKNAVLLLNPKLENKLQETAATIYQRILHDYSRFAVSTIDSFILQVIRGFAFELNLQSDFKVEMDKDKIIEFLMQQLSDEVGTNIGLQTFITELIEEKISNNESWDYEKELRKETEIIFTEGFDRFEKYLAGTNAPAFSELIKKYATESKSFNKRFITEAENICEAIATTINAWQIPVDDYVGKSRSPLFKLASGNWNSSDDEALVKLATYVNYENCFKCSGYEECFQQLQQLVSRLKEHLQLLPEYMLRDSSVKRLSHLYFLEHMIAFLKMYREETESIHISDTIKLVLGITEDAGENPSFIWEKTGNRYRHFLWDEFQDTSSKQWNSLKGLFKNALSSSNAKSVEHLIVGDVKQAIYRFRNGDWRILHKQIADDIGHAFITQESLLENYRSCANIIAFNNAIFPQIASIIQSEICTLIERNNVEHPATAHLADVVSSIYSQVVQQQPKACRSGGIIKVNEIDSENYQTTAIEEMIAEIQQLLEQEFPLKEIAVLVYRNAEAALVVNALLKEGVPVISSEALTIAENTAIKLLINTLQWLTASAANASYYKSHCILHYNNLIGKTVSGDDYLLCTSETIQSLNHLLPNSIINNFSSYRALPMYELIEALINDYGLSGMTAQIPFLLAFRDLVTTAGCLDIPGFLRWWHDDGIKQTLPANEATNAINVMTIHKSKGLAFGAVFIPFMDQALKKSKGIFWVPTAQTPFSEIGFFPFSLNKKLQASQIGSFYVEEIAYQYIDTLNAFYVGATRAKNYLYFSPKIKKAPTLTNIGDVFLRAFNHCKKEAGLTLGDATPNITDTPETQFNLTSIPYTPRMAEWLHQKEERNHRFVSNVEKAGKRGLELHEILAVVNNEAELDALLSKQEKSKALSIDEAAVTRNEALAVLKHPALQPLFENAVKVESERAIVDENGTTFRPDKIIFKKNETVLLDYKFTLKEEQQHIHQLNNYRALLQRMGYENVSAYLFYARSKKLKLV